MMIIAAAPALAHPAWGIVVDPRGEIFFSDLETIWRIDSDGRLSVARPGVSGRHVHELALGPDGRVRGQDFEYASDTGRYRESIWELSPAGTTGWIVAPTERFPRGVSLWSDLVGNAYAVDQNDNTRQQTRILRRAPGGRVTVLAGDAYGHSDGTGAGAKFEKIVGMTVGPDRAFYVTDNSTVRRVSFNGVVTTLAVNFDGAIPAAYPSASTSSVGLEPSSMKPRTLMDGPADPIAAGELMGLTVTPTREVYVADFKNRRLVRVDRAGRKSVVLTAAAPWSPTGVAMDSAGYVYSLEVGFRSPDVWIKPRVRRLAPDGKVTLLATVPDENVPRFERRRIGLDSSPNDNGGRER